MPPSSTRPRSCPRSSMATCEARRLRRRPGAWQAEPSIESRATKQPQQPHGLVERFLTAYRKGARDDQRRIRRCRRKPARSADRARHPRHPCQVHRAAGGAARAGAGLYRRRRRLDEKASRTIAWYKAQNMLRGSRRRRYRHRPALRGGAAAIGRIRRVTDTISPSTISTGAGRGFFRCTVPTSKRRRRAGTVRRGSAQQTIPGPDRRTGRGASRAACRVRKELHRRAVRCASG